MNYYKKPLEVKINLSSQTMKRFAAEVPIDKVREINLYSIPVDKLPLLLTAGEFQQLKLKYGDKLKIMSELSFGVTDKSVLIIGKGWGCQRLHVLDKSNYYPLKMYFTDAELFRRLIKHLLKGGVPDGVFLI
jgi:hypothetical protein